MDEEGRVHPDCRNASNPYHKCSEYCFKIIAESKKKINPCDSGWFPLYLAAVTSCLQIKVGRKD